MRTAYWKAHLLPLLLLSLYSVSVCLAYSCAFDEFMKSINLQVIATAADQQTGQNWEPIRIVTSIKDLEVQTKYCKKSDGTIQEHDSKKPDAQCKDLFDSLSPEQKTTVKDIAEKAIVLHTDRLLVQRAVGPLKIPRFSTHPHCMYFNVPAEHHTTGVANADMVLYVAFNRQLRDAVNVLSLGVTCAKSARGRPIAGALTFGLNNVDISRTTVRLAAHQIAHALGFSYGEMNSRGMIVDKTVRGKPNSVALVKSDKTKKMAQEHYGCPTVEDMELEDGENNNEKRSHWERRNTKDELMATPVGVTGTLFMGFYTSLTMAAFEDMGFYKANFTMAEHMEYGHGVGCEFLTGKCMDNDVTKWPKMFCNELESDEHTEVCTTDRLGLGNCLLQKDYNPALPEYFRYFTSDKKGGPDSFLADYCPVVEQHNNKGCAHVKEEGEMPGNIFGKNSMCLDGNALHARVTSGSFSVAAVCAEISCVGGSVKVKYDGDKNKWHDCPEGQSLTPSLTSESFGSGTINCPKYKEVCTVAPDGSSLVLKVVEEPPTNAPQNPKASQDPKASQKPTGQPNDPKSGGKSKDSSSVPFGLIPSMTFLVLSFAGYLIG